MIHATTVRYLYNSAAGVPEFSDGLKCAVLSWLNLQVNPHLGWDFNYVKKFEKQCKKKITMPDGLG